MSLPQATIATTTYSGPFRAPRDRVVRAFTSWERGGLGIQDPTEGLDVYDWFIRCDKDTGEVFYSVPDPAADGMFLVPETLVHAIDPLPREVKGSFDTNMRPIIVWRDVLGDSYYRWFDPVANDTVIVSLARRTHSLRVALDDVRDPMPAIGVTDTIIAYVRGTTVYWRELRDRFLDEYTARPGFPLLYQIGLNNLLRFQFARSPEQPDGPANLNYLRPPARAGKLAGFDELGDATFYDWPAPGVVGDQGLSLGHDKLVVTENGQTFFLRDEDGVWQNATVDVRVDFYLDNVELRASRTFTFSADAEGRITRETSAADGDVSVDISEVGVGTRTYTGTFTPVDGGDGVTFNLVSVFGLPTNGEFVPAWNGDGDFFGGGIVPTGAIHYTDYGTFAVLRTVTDGAYTARSSTTRLRWLADSLPVPLRPATTRVASCTVSNGGVSVAGLAQFEPDGSAEFWPLTVDTQLLRGEFVRTTNVIREKGLPSDWQLAFVKAGPSSFAAVPSISLLDPDAVERFSSDFLLTVTGTGFTDASVIRVDGVPLTTAFNSGTELEATVSSDVALLAATHDVRVFTPTPGGGLSNELTFDVENPIAVLTLLDPDSVAVNEPDTDITITGTDFVPDSVAELDGVPTVTVYVSDTELTATVPTSMILSADVRDVTVVHTGPGGGTSNALELTLTAILALQFTDGYTPPDADSIILTFIE
jgi:hypothetical protein